MAWHYTEPRPQRRPLDAPAGRTNGGGGGGAPSGPAGGDLSGSYPNPELRALAVGTPELADGAVTDAKVTSVAYAKVTGAPSIPTTLPPSGPAGGDLAGSTYPGPTIAAGAVTTTKLGDAPNGVTTAKINDGAVTNAKIADVAWSKVTGAPTSFPPSGAAGGDLSGTYPNPVVARSTSTEFFVGTGTPKLHVVESSTGLGGFMSNANQSGSVMDDPTRSAWRVDVDAQNDRFRIYRAPPGGPPALWGIIATISNAGKMTIGADPTAALDVATKQYVDARTAAGLHIGADPPPTPTVGQLWWRTDDGTLFIYYDDGTSEQFVPATPTVAGPPGPAGTTGPAGTDIIEESNTQVTAGAGVTGAFSIGSAMLTSGVIQVGKAYRYEVSGHVTKAVSTTFQVYVMLGNLAVAQPAAVSASVNTARFHWDVVFYVVSTTSAWVRALWNVATNLPAGPPTAAAIGPSLVEGEIGGLDFAYGLQLMGNFATGNAGTFITRRRAVVSVA